MKTLGILGVGHLSEHLVLGWMRAARDYRLILSRRSTQRVRQLAADYTLLIAADNQDLLNRSDAVLLAVRPESVDDALRGLLWRPDQVLVSAVAGRSLESLAPRVAPARVVRVMPVIAAAVGESATAIYPPDPEVQKRFRDLGQVFVLREESEFEAASIAAVYYGCLYALLGTVSQQVAAFGLREPAARALVAQMTRGAASMAQAFDDQSLENMTAEIATPGSYTQSALSSIEERGGLTAWSAACAEIGRRLTSGDN